GGGDATAQIVGDWLGPAPGDTGQCGVAYGEWFFQSAGSYTFTENSDATAYPNTMTPAPADCAGLTLYGTYAVQGNQIVFHQQGDPGCPPCQQTADFSVTYRFIDANDVQMCDTTPGGSCYLYARQH
ncbi:MAG TPA: hypothetical protein VFA70_14245, partial [Dehalococcoidia bacterium]|nr:hypothetical protein [Dehalococcoidia bacterium]